MALLDRLLAFLLRPRIRRLRRWAFVVTLPTAALVAWRVDLDLGVGPLGVIALRLVLALALALVASRLAGERREAILDVVMHPRARAFFRAELDVLLAVPRLVLTRLVSPPAALRYTSGHHGTAVALAFAPTIAAEALAAFLLIPPSWVTIHVASIALHVYGLLWLIGWALGPAAYPHRVGRGVLTARNGPLYRVRLPLDAIVAATARRERVPGDRGLLVEGEVALLSARGRVDLWLELDREVSVQRPLGQAVTVRRLGLASDDPDTLARLLVAPARRDSTEARRDGFGGVIGALDLAGLAREATQPG